MTVLVGVKCTDGVVIGADSMATNAMGRSPLVQLITDDKLRIVGDRIIVAATGSVGLAQRLKLQLDKRWEAKNFKGQCMDCMTQISATAVADFQSSGVPRTAQGDLQFGALLAVVIDNQAHLVEFGTADFQPEIRQGTLFAASLGSGQLLADPFLAFVTRVLWKGVMPNVEMGKIGVYWVLNHAIQYAPGGVGHPIKLGVVKKDAKNEWKASIFDDTQEQAQFIEEMEARIGAVPNSVVESADASPPPAPPPAPNS